MHVKLMINMNCWMFDRLKNIIFVFNLYVNAGNRHAHKSCFPLNKHACKNAQLINGLIITIYLFNHVFLLLYSFMNRVLFSRILFIIFVKTVDSVLYKGDRTPQSWSSIINHGSAWLIMHLCNSLWISIISIIDWRSSIMRLMELHNSIYGAP